MAADLWTALFIALLAVFVGYEVISRVPTLLHTPLMSGSNFIHGIVLVGGIATIMGAMNVTGGYVVTERILAMFDRTKKKGGPACRTGFRSPSMRCTSSPS